MKITNYYYLDQLLAPLNTCSREEESKINHIDPNDEQAVRAIIKLIIQPDYEQFSDDSKERIRDALQYFLTTRSAPFAAIISAQQESPLRRPDEPINLFIWIWKELFPNKSFELQSTEGWSVENDIEKICLTIKK
jgi:hypothetical protein